MGPGLGHVAAGIAAFALTFQAAAAAELKVLTTPALHAVWDELASKFEAQGHKLNVVYAASGAIAKRVAEGEAADVVVSTAAGIDDLTKGGKLIPGTGAPVASSGVAVAVLKGAPKPDVSTPEALKKALLAAKAVAYTDPASGGASGIHFAKVLDRLGIASEVNAKAKLGSGVPAGSFVVKGEADLAVQQVPELLAVEGIEIAGPLPADLQSITRFAAGVHATSKDIDAAKALIRFLATPEAAAVIKAKGLDPAPSVPPKAS